jgi:hypothetical protein
LKTAEIYHSAVLDDDYVRDGGGAVFRSGVKYTSREINLIKGISKETLQMIHKLKFEFHGEVVR